jgi:hypothetical protein
LRDTRPFIDFTHCCPLCKNPELQEFASKYCSLGSRERFFETKSATEIRKAFLAGTLTDEIYNSYWEFYKCTAEKILLKTFRGLRSILHLRELEMLHAAALFDRLCTAHGKCETFLPIRDNLLGAFSVCVMLAFKWSNDKPFPFMLKSQQLFSLERGVLEGLEVIVLRLLDWNCCRKEGEGETERREVEVEKE